jgi:hypothetical protein
LEAQLPAEEGGNFLIDGYEVLQQLEEDPETRRRVDVNVEREREEILYVCGSNKFESFDLIP